MAFWKPGYMWQKAPPLGRVLTKLKKNNCSRTHIKSVYNVTITGIQNEENSRFDLRQALVMGGDFHVYQDLKGILLLPIVGTWFCCMTMPESIIKEWELLRHKSYSSNLASPGDHLFLSMKNPPCLVNNSKKFNI